MTGVPIKGKAKGSAGAALCSSSIPRPLFREIAMSQDTSHTIPGKRQLRSDLSLRHAGYVQLANPILYGSIKDLHDANSGGRGNIHTIRIPTATKQEARYVRHADPKHRCNTFAGKNAIERMDGLNVGIRERAVLLQMRRWRQALNMLWIDASTVLTAVMDMPTAWDRTVNLLVRETMGINGMRQAAITIGHFGSGPIPATRINVDLIRERQLSQPIGNRGIWSKLGMHSMSFHRVPCLGWFQPRRGLLCVSIIPEKPAVMGFWGGSYV